MWRSRNRLLSRENSKAWNRANKAKKNAHTKKREATKLNRTPKWLTSLHFDQIEVFYQEAQRITELPGIKMNVDHIVPLQGKNVSGLHVPWNLQVITAVANYTKHNNY